MRFFYLCIFVISIFYGLFSISLYSVIILRFIIKLPPLPVVFSCKGFHVNLVFFFIFVFHYHVIDFNRFPKYIMIHHQYLSFESSSVV